MTTIEPETSRRDAYGYIHHTYTCVTCNRMFETPKKLAIGPYCEECKHRYKLDKSYQKRKEKLKEAREEGINVLYFRIKEYLDDNNVLDQKALDDICSSLPE